MPNVTKATGAEWKAFMADKEYWPEEYYHDDVLINVNGYAEPYTSPEPETLADDDELLVESGFVAVSADEIIAELDVYFERWKKDREQRREPTQCVIANPTGWLDNETHPITDEPIGETLLIRLHSALDGGITHTDEAEGVDYAVDLSWIRSNGKVVATTGEYTNEQIHSWKRIS